MFDVDYLGKLVFRTVDDDLLFEDPHVHSVFVERKAFAVAANDRRDRAAPVAAADDADLIDLIRTVLRVGINVHLAHVERLGPGESMRVREVG